MNKTKTHVPVGVDSKENCMASVIRPFDEALTGIFILIQL